jgi:zinc protease
MNNPQGVFRDTVRRTMGSYNFRSAPVTDKDVNALNLDNMYRIYKERFSNAGDFVFTFVGSIDTSVFKPLVEKYIGGIPSTSKHEKFVDRNIETPKGFINKKVYKGTEPKSYVYIDFTGPATYSRDELIRTQALTQLLDIKLRETLRQAMSGVYGVGTRTALNHYPKETFSSIIVFGCAPDNVDTLIGASYKVVNKVIQDGCNEEDLLKVKEQMKKDRETNMQENSFWTGYIQNCVMNDYDIADIDEFNKVVDKLTSEDFKKLATKYFNKKNLAQFVLYPEKN